ncbi:MAG: hypothetical protein KAS59_05340 [Alphaproteobacteria bacterium]|nr:hypothetical protein [Alphaproteobacteria bacterium]
MMGDTNTFNNASNVVIEKDKDKHFEVVVKDGKGGHEIEEVPIAGWQHD